MDMKMNELARVGFVVSRQPEKHRVRVEFRDTVTAKLVSGWLPVLVPRASADMAFDLPDVGDQVLCLFLGNGLEELRARLHVRGADAARVERRQVPPDVQRRHDA